MAFLIPVSFAVPVPETDPLIQCIIENKLKNLHKLIRGRDINGLYSSEVWTDDITLLIAAVLCRNEEICSYLLEKSADPNIRSKNGWTPLHYAALTEVPLSIVERLLAANADPDGIELEIFTPLQCAVDQGREDIVKALIEAGALPERNYGRHPELDKKVERMIFQLSSQGEVFEKVHLFFSLCCAAQRKHQTEVYRVYNKHFFQEHPLIHTVLFEHYFGVIVPDPEQYHQSAIKWLEDTKSADRYIKGVIKRFPNLPQECWPIALCCLNAALCVSESVSPQVFSDLVPILTNILQDSGNSDGETVISLILQILNVMMQKTSEKLQKLDDSLRHPAGLCAMDSLCEEMCAALLTIRKKKKIQHESQSQEVELLVKVELYPDTVVTSIEETNSSVQPFTQPTENSRRWHQTSRRWRSKLEQLANIDASRTYRLPGLTLVIDPEFLIAKGSDGTQVFLGLRDDGTEVAVKRMIKSNYQVLRNEEQFLRLPELDNPFIVRYVDYAEDDNFGYLVLQLCEYTLEEYIHLPNSAERSLDLKKLVKEVLCSLQVLHDQKTKVLHRDIKPQNVLIDIKGTARLADFGISRRLKQDETTLRTSIAGTKCWKAKENIKEKFNTRYKRSSDIQVAGMLVYYILSGGQHPFGEQPFCEVNILEGRYSLEHLSDDVAKDLVEWMINENPNNRPTVEQTLTHPFFWTDKQRVWYLKILGNEKEAENCRNADEELLNAIAKHTEGKSFSEWKTRLPSELVQKLDGKKKAYPENTLGLLRFIRNLHEHYKVDAVKTNLMALFPDLFGSVYMFAKERGWNSRESVIMDIKSAS